MSSQKKIPVFLAFVMICALHLPAQQLNKKLSLLMEPADAQGRVAIAVTSTEMPGQKFVIELPEIFTLQNSGSGLFNYSKQVWKYSEQGAEMVLADAKYQYGIKLKLVGSKKMMGIKWDMSFTNNTDSTRYDLAAFNCFTMNFAPLFKDTKMERTFVYDSAGNKILLKDVRKNQGAGKRNMQFYPAYNGIDLTQSNWINQWGVNSNQYLTGKKISVLSTDENWIFENCVDGKVAFFFNNWEQDHGCVHASPLLKRELHAGETAKASGMFLFKKLKK